MSVYMNDFSQANLSQSARVMSVSGSMRTDTLIGQDECALCTRGAGEGRANYVPHHQHFSNFFLFFDFFFFFF